MGTRPRWLPFRRLEARELTGLMVGLGACLLLWGFLALASEVMEGNTTALDARILRAFRQVDDPSQPRGPQWLQSAFLDISAIGGPTVLGLVVLGVVGFLVLQGRSHTATVVFATAVSGDLANYALKSVFLRQRPDVVPHLRDVATTSFPSGHAMDSAIVYLTLGAMLMRLSDRPLTKLYCLGLAIFVTFIVGVSRVYLGVHYPTDVIAGWIFGFAWASICWLIARRFERETGVAAEREHARKD